MRKLRNTHVKFIIRYLSKYVTFIKLLDLLGKR